MEKFSEFVQVPPFSHGVDEHGITVEHVASVCVSGHVQKKLDKSFESAQVPVFSHGLLLHAAAVSQLVPVNADPSVVGHVHV